MFWDRFYQLCMDMNTRPNPVGGELGFSSGVITKWKNGKVPEAKALIAIADYFHCSVDFLLGRTDVAEVGGRSVVLSDDELVLLDRYRSLADGGKEIVRSRALEQLQLENLSRGTDEGAAVAG